MVPRLEIPHDFELTFLKLPALNFACLYNEKIFAFVALMNNVITRFELHNFQAINKLELFKPIELLKQLTTVKVFKRNVPSPY